MAKPLQTSPVVGNDFVEDFGPPPVPLPAAGWMLLASIVAFFGLWNRRKRSATV